MFAALILLLVQLVQAPVTIRGNDYEITVPHGWKVVIGSPAVARLEHSAGATLRINTVRSAEKFETFSRNAVERLADPLGFAKIGEPRRFSDSHLQWIEYEVRGNRLSERKRIFYRATRTETGIAEIVYENSEDRFDLLKSEALSIVSSLKSIPRKVRVRQ
jgi:hypothetical protein